MFSNVSRFQKTGDLIFCRDNGVVSRLLRVGQQGVDGLPAPYSHAAICLTPGLLLHSVPDGGVQLLGIEEQSGEAIDFAPKSKDSVKVLRLDSLDANEMLKAMLYWTGQRYNFRLLSDSGSGDGRAFCSQLLVQILTKIGFKIPGVESDHRITPSRLYRAISEAGATDVSAEYRAYAIKLQDSAEECQLLAHDVVRVTIRRTVEQNLLLAHFRTLVGTATDHFNHFGSESLARVQKLLETRPGGGKEIFEAHCTAILGQVSAAIGTFDLVGPNSPVRNTFPAGHWMDELRPPEESMASTGALVHSLQLASLAKATEGFLNELTWIRHGCAILAEDRSDLGAGDLEFLELSTKHLEAFATAEKGKLVKRLRRIDTNSLSSFDRVHALGELRRLVALTQSQWEQFATLEFEAVAKLKAVLGVKRTKEGGYGDG